MALVKYGPAFLPAAVANAYTPPASPILTVIRQIHLSNVTATAATATIYIGATGGSAAGTEVIKGVTIPPNSEYYMNGMWPLKSTDFLTWLSGTASAITGIVSTDQSVIP